MRIAFNRYFQRLRSPRGRAFGVLTTALLLIIAFSLRSSERQAARADGPPRNGITVSADGSATLPPDIARISANIETRTETANDALSQNTDTLDAVIAGVRALGATDRDIQTSGVRLDPINAPGGGVTGYRAVNAVTIRTTDLTRLGDLIQAMVNAGATNISSVDYALQDPDQLQLLAVKAAIANARRRGEAAATALGVQIGDALDFSFGVKAPAGLQNEAAPRPANAPAAPPPPPPPTAAARAAAPAPPVLPTSFNASMTVTVTYGIAAR